MCIQPRQVRPGRLVAVSLLILSALGCGAGRDVEARGRIYFGKEPLKATGLAQAIVQFHAAQPTDGQTRKMYQGTLDDEGNYTVKAPPGKYTVVVIATKMPKSKNLKSNINYGVPEFVIPQSYGDVRKTDKTVEVKTSAAPGDYDIRLLKPGKA